MVDAGGVVVGSCKSAAGVVDYPEEGRGALDGVARGIDKE